MLKILKVQSQQGNFLEVIYAVTKKLFDEEHNFLELLINKKNEQFSVGYIFYIFNTPFPIIIFWNYL